MSSPSLWSRIRKGRLVQILAVYLGAAWVVVQVVDSLQDLLHLPDWVGPVTVLLLVIGLIITLATAWVQSHPLLGRRPEGEDVPGAWELKVGDAVKDVSGGRLPHLTWARALAGGAIAFSLLFGMAGLYVVAKDRGAAFAHRAAAAPSAPDGIAVLPFTVRGAALADWREGMVDLLSTGLDGAGGLRSIASRTVLARWHEMVPDDAAADASVELEVARRTGARYALLGSAVAIGPNVRLTAEVYTLDHGAPLGQPVYVEGHPDSVLTLVDRLTVRVLGLILERDEGDLPRIDLASVTTQSVPALKTYLEGEALFRRGDFNRAIEAYESATRQDSTFGLAYFRLGQALGWNEGLGNERSTEADERVLRLVDRLPEREAAIVRGASAVSRYRSGSAELMQDVVHKYPDDAEAWFHLGEAYLHVRETLGTWEEAEAALERAVSLAPRFAPYRLHLIEAAFRHHADSARVERHLSEYERLAPESPAVRRYRLAQHLAFDDGTARDSALNEVRRLPPGIDFRHVTFALGNPLFWETRETLLRDALDRVPPAARVGLRYELAFSGFFARGHARKAIEETHAPGMPGTARISIAAFLDQFGVSVPRDDMDAALDRAEAGRVEPDAAFDVGLYAANHGRWAAYRNVLALLEAGVDSLAAAGDSATAARTQANASILEGYALGKRGEVARGIERMEAAREEARNEASRWWLALMYLETGRLADAARYFRSLNTWDPNPLAHYQLGRIYEQTGELDRARASYEFFVANWATADPELQPLVEDARRSLTRLATDRRLSADRPAAADTRD